MTKPLLELKNVEKTYESENISVNVLKQINLTINKGEFTAITGRSGSGKSTLMNIIGLLDTPTTGFYYLDGKDVSKYKEDELSDLRNKKIGFVFQSFNLLLKSSIFENVVLPGIYAGLSEKKRSNRAILLLSQLGLSGKENKKPNQLSGGEQQRVAIARALMNNPEIILADEPTGNLDTKSGLSVISILKYLNKKGTTVILITHEKDIASKAGRIIELIDGEISHGHKRII